MIILAKGHLWCHSKYLLYGQIAPEKLMIVLKQNNFGGNELLTRHGICKKFYTVGFSG